MDNRRLMIDSVESDREDTTLSSLEDLKLHHYYTMVLARTLSLPGAIGRTWEEGVPQLAFEGEHIYLIHAILASAAAHKVSRNPTDIQSYNRGYFHYTRSTQLLNSLDLTARESNPAAALATQLLLVWYESLNGSWETGLLVSFRAQDALISQHMHSAAKIIRDHQGEILRSPIGRQLLHLYTRLELSASRHLFLDERSCMSNDAVPLDLAVLDLETLKCEDYTNGTSDFEEAWIGIMKIMIPIAGLRMIPRTSDRGTLERKIQGQQILDQLGTWEISGMALFQAVEAPATIVILPDFEIREYIEPIYYVSLNHAVAMGTLSH
jgi:Fungal specific transcription factor domain